MRSDRQYVVFCAVNLEKAMSDISLTASMRSNLLSLQNTQSLMDRTQERLSTGKKVNSAIDNPSSYYTAQSLNNRASDLSALLDSMGQAVQTIKAANEGIETITSFAEQAKAVANTALDTADIDQITSSQKQFNEILKQIDQLADDAGYKGVNLLEGDELTVTFNETRSSTLTIQGEKADSASLGLTEATGWDKVSDTTTTAAQEFEDATTALEEAQAVDVNADATVVEKKEAYDQAVTDYGDGADDDDGAKKKAMDEAKVAWDNALAEAQKTKDENVAAAKAEYTTKESALKDAQKADIKANKETITKSITDIEGAINTLRSMASTYGNNYSIVENRQDFTDSLINVLTEGADNLTLADMNEESANMLALQTRQQLAINSLSLASQASQAVLKLF